MRKLIREKKEPPAAGNYWKAAAAGGVLYCPDHITDDFM